MAPGEAGTNTGFTAKLSLRRFPSEGNCWSSHCRRSGLLEAGAFGSQTHSEAVIHPLRRSFHFQACRLPTRWRDGHVPISAPPPGQSGMLCALRAAQEGKSQRKPLLSSSLLSSAETCLGAGSPSWSWPWPLGARLALRSLEGRLALCNASQNLSPRPSTSATGISGNPRASSEFRKPTAQGKTSLGRWLS